MDWKREFDRLARKVGFVPLAELPVIAYASRPEESLALWTSPYAGILIWEPLSEISDLEQRWRQVQDWFDAILVEREKDRTGTFDGFLVVVLSAEAATSGNDLISKIEMDTAVCRKLFIWPGRNGQVDIGVLVHELTPLGLPNAGRAVEVAQLPDLADEQREFIASIEQVKSGSRKAQDDLQAMGWPLQETTNEAH